jgi:hypothetical protein
VNSTDSEASPERRSRLTPLLKNGLAFAVSAAFLYWIIRYQIREPAQLWAHMKGARLLPLLAGFVLVAKPDAALTALTWLGAVPQLPPATHLGTIGAIYVAGACAWFWARGDDVRAVA